MVVSTQGTSSSLLQDLWAYHQAVLKNERIYNAHASPSRSTSQGGSDTGLTHLQRQLNSVVLQNQSLQQENDKLRENLKTQKALFEAKLQSKSRQVDKLKDDLAANKLRPVDNKSSSRRSHRDLLNVINKTNTGTLFDEDDDEKEIEDDEKDDSQVFDHKQLYELKQDNIFSRINLNHLDFPANPDDLNSSVVMEPKRRIKLSNKKIEGLDKESQSP